MSMVMCNCGTFIDSDYDVECFMVNDEVACESCRCLECGERRAADGLETCWNCAVEEFENDPTVIDTYETGARLELLANAARVDAERTAKLQEACGANLTTRQAS